MALRLHICKQRRVSVSYQPLTQVCVQATRLYFVTNNIRPIYSFTVVKSGRVMVWKVIMIVEAAGLK